ncbi:24819_t:CDS:2 [Gigaspora margarita]|uniref:24819_t:CDS:1 n=1 Tax=Gigaspora margarita TaxID=4874 RepID=A0ABN7UR88_GIGMA|nr:24819_t:CDS:2 [Gigaspora margarita]
MRRNGIENDYLIAMQLQEMYNKKSTSISNEYKEVPEKLSNQFTAKKIEEKIWKDDEDERFDVEKNYRNKIKFEIAKVTQDIVDSNEFKITKTVTITLDIIVNSNYYSIVFTLHLKDSIVCHVNCELGMESNSGTDHFIHCSCMGTNNKCPYVIVGLGGNFNL